MKNSQLLMSRARIWIKIILKTGLAFPGLIIKALVYRSPGLRVLFYHRVNPYPMDKLGLVSREITVTPEAFAAQLAYLKKKGFHSLSPQELKEQIECNAPRDPKAILITFDDGYRDNYIWAAPLLRYFGFSGIVFVTTDFVGRESIDSESGGDAPGCGQFLTWEQIKEMQGDGMIFGSHTCTHQLLTGLENSKLEEELRESSRLLRERLNPEVMLFAYPGGDVNERVERAVVDAGYDGAFTTVPGDNAVGVAKSLLRRTEVSASDTSFVFKMKCAGALDWLWFKESAALRSFIGRCNSFLIGLGRSTKKTSSAPLSLKTCNRPIRLLQVVTRMDTGGVPNHLMTLLEGLTKYDYEITVACREIDERFKEKLTELGVRVFLIDLKRSINPLSDIKAIFKLYRHMREGQYDIVHTHMSKAALLGSIVGRLARVPVIINTAHNLGFLALKNPVLKRVFWLYDKTLFFFCVDSVITVSEIVRSKIVKARILSESKAAAIVNGLDLTPFKDCTTNLSVLKSTLGLEGRGLIIGTVTRLVWFKGLDTFVSAASEVLKVYPDTRFVIVGDGPLREDLRRQADGLGIGESLLFLGERTDVPELLQIFDIFALSSVSEGMPISILEAMAASKPVVATSVGGVPELVADGETGSLVNSGDSSAFGDALINIIGNSALRFSMGEKGRRRLEREFDVDKMVRSTDELYRRLLKNKKR